MSSIIFFDVDGTLITEDARMIIPESTRYAIAERGCTYDNSGKHSLCHSGNT